MTSAPTHEASMIVTTASGTMPCTRAPRVRSSRRVTSERTRSTTPDASCVTPSWCRADQAPWLLPPGPSQDRTRSTLQDTMHPYGTVGDSVVGLGQRWSCERDRDVAIVGLGDLAVATGPEQSAGLRAYAEVEGRRPASGGRRSAHTGTVHRPRGSCSASWLGRLHEVHRFDPHLNGMRPR